MKLIAGSALLLLVAGIVGLSQPATAGISDVSLELIEKLKISADLPEAPPIVVEEEYFDDVIDEDNVKDLPEIPVEVDTEGAERRAAGACNILIRSGLTDSQPVFLETDAAAFYPYCDGGYMEVASGKTMQMFCPGNFKMFAETLITATCVSGTTFRVDDTSYKFSEFICNSWPEYVIKKTGTPCNGGTLLRVGFEVSSSRFVEQMQICFNEEEEVTRYVHHSLRPGNYYHQTGVDRISFKTNGFFDNKNVNQLYTQKSQQNAINAELGGENHQYFDNSKGMFLARGHMAAKADFVYGSQQRATFTFVNVAPQWQVFNAGNWARVEDGVRSWVSKSKISVQCYTGVYGVTTLSNNEGRETPLYLARDANNNGLIPVPKLYFRVVIHPDTKRGIVFVGVNNPHLTMEQIQKDYIICKDVSDQVNYINWKKHNIVAGYSYACEVSDFRRTVKDLPDLTANGGLLV